MRCPRCHSTDVIQIGRLIYCRHCVTFGQIRPDTQVRYPKIEPAKKDVHIQLDYVLSPEQKILACGIQKAIANRKHVLIEAVCGSGKTELVYPVICRVLAQGKTVGFSLPRKDLAIEIFERLSGQIKGVNATLVYGGHHQDCYAALVVCTTHQLYRYWQFFDLLIIDETDAFPFYQNQLLNEMAVSACKGQFILMSATSDVHHLPKSFKRFCLNRRYHGHDLPVPQLWRTGERYFVWRIRKVLTALLQSGGLCLVFVPVKRDIPVLLKRLKRHGFHALGISSATPQPQVILDQFRAHAVMILVTTTLLERGVTFENVHIFVYRADHRVFNTATLIQIAGRAGRKPNYPNGQVYFVGKRVTKEMRQCQKHIIAKNNA